MFRDRSADEKRQSSLAFGLFGEAGARGLVRLGPVLRDPSHFGLRQRHLQLVCAQVTAIGWSTGMLPPRVGQRTGVDAVEADRVDQVKHQAFGDRHPMTECLEVAGERAADITRTDDPDIYIHFLTERDPPTRGTAWVMFDS